MDADEKKALARAKHAAYMREWTQRNPEKVKAARDKAKALHGDAIKARKAAHAEVYKERRNANRRAAYQKRPRPKKPIEERRARNRAQHYKNREKRLEQKRAWAAANRHRGAAYSQKRRAIQLRAMPAWANSFFIESAFELATLRSRVTGIPWEVDHIVPLINPLVCGLHVEHNLRVIPMVINRSKGNSFYGGLA